ncbi:transcription antitermination factor NusB [Candidatus Omnitrophota bacterium]
MRKRTLARECALKILYRIEIAKDSVDSSMEDFWSRESMAKDVKEFAVSLIKGTCKNLSKIDSVISENAANWKIKRIAVIDKNVLRLGIFEMLYMDDIPVKVSINEAIELAKKYGDVDSGKFVNGILDNVRKVECKK